MERANLRPRTSTPSPQHSLLVETLVGADGHSDSSLRLAALLHDAPEYVVGDLISPFKAVLGNGYKAIEHRLLAAVHARFGIGEPTLEASATIKSADRAAARLEAVHLAGFAEAEADEFFGRPLIAPQTWHGMLEPRSAATVQAAFLDRFHHLVG